jgi:hypothetical protein
MSTFGCEIKKVKTRKPHRCETCCRIIPSGITAYHTGGMWEGDWQNWYMCKFCHDHEVWESGEYVSDGDFTQWLYEQDFYNCPSCKGIDPETGKKHRCNPDWDWSEDDEIVLFECDICDHKWSVYIGWGKED